MKTAVEFFSEGLFNILQEAENNNIFEVSTQNFKRYIEMFSKEAKEMEEKQRQEDKLTGMKEANELLDELIDKNMCSNSGDILIKQFKKRINL